MKTVLGLTFVVLSCGALVASAEDNSAAKKQFYSGDIAEASVICDPQVFAAKQKFIGLQDAQNAILPKFIEHMNYVNNIVDSLPEHVRKALEDHKESLEDIKKAEKKIAVLSKKRNAATVKANSLREKMHAIIMKKYTDQLSQAQQREADSAKAIFDELTAQPNLQSYIARIECTSSAERTDPRVAYKLNDSESAGLLMNGRGMEEFRYGCYVPDGVHHRLTFADMMRTARVEVTYKKDADGNILKDAFSRPVMQSWTTVSVMEPDTEQNWFITAHYPEAVRAMGMLEQDSQTKEFKMRVDSTVPMMAVHFKSTLNLDTGKVSEEAPTSDSVMGMPGLFDYPNPENDTPEKLRNSTLFAAAHFGQDCVSFQKSMLDDICQPFVDCPKPAKKPGKQKK